MSARFQSRPWTVAAVLTAWIVMETAAGAQVSFEEKRLLTVPPPPAGWLAEDWEPIVSADGRRAAAVVPLWKGNRPRRMYHFGALGKQSCYLLLVDDRVLDPCSFSYVPPAFSPDARHIIYVRADRDGSTIYLDETPVAKPSAAPMSLWIMSDGTPGYVLEERTGGPGQRQWVVLGPRQDSPYERVGKVSLSPDGASLAYVGNVAGQQNVVAQGRKWPDFANVHDIAWTPNGRELVVLGRSAKCAGQPVAHSCWCISRGEDCVPEDDLHPGRMAISPEGARVAIARHRTVRHDGYQPGRDDRFWVSYGGFRGPEILRLDVGPVLDGSGAHLAYAGTTASGGVQVFRDARPLGKPARQVNDLAISPDGAHVAWTGGVSGRFRVFVDGAAAGPTREWTKDVTFDPAGRRVAYAARDVPGGPWRIVVGTVAGPPCDWVARPHWSADGKRVVYAARIGREVWWKALVLP